jgi:hypothetical protein
MAWAHAAGLGEMLNSRCTLLVDQSEGLPSRRDVLDVLVLLGFGPVVDTGAPAEEAWDSLHTDTS